MPTFAIGCAVNSQDRTGFAAAVSACNASDVCVLALGTDESIANEGNDRSDTSLPGVQSALALAILDCGKPTILVLFNGATLAIDSLLATARDSSLAVVEAWNPGVAGGTPIAAALFGKTNTWGKLPVSWYPEAYFKLLPIQDMDMVLGGGGAGRTYKYYNATSVATRTNTSGALLFPLGYGLSYTTFTLSGTCPNNPPSLVVNAADSSASPSISCTVTVANTGPLDGDEVVIVYVIPNATSVARARAALWNGGPRSDPLASRLVVAFERVHVAAGGRVDIPFNFSVPTFSSVDDSGARVVYPGQYVLRFSHGTSDSDASDVDVTVVVEIDGAERHVVRAAYPTW